MTKYKPIKTNRLPFSWCAGCGLTIIASSLADYMKKNGLNKHNASVVSGIGCTGRSAGYFNMDTMHTTHGRAVCVAEGLKLAKDSLNVFVMSGDGDLYSIGLSHLIHASRRNADIKVICVDNSTYAMTGGQTSPTTPVGRSTKTTPEGTFLPQLNAFDIVCKPFNRFFARISPLQKELFHGAIDKAISIKGFALIEIMITCFERDRRNISGNNPVEALKQVQDRFTLKQKNDYNLNIDELGIAQYEKEKL